MHLGAGSQAGNDEGGKLGVGHHCSQTLTPKAGERQRREELPHFLSSQGSGVSIGPTLAFV